MKREIKFRAWDKQNKEMIYMRDLFWFEEESVRDTQNTGYEIMQFTGLQDRNGKGIYESDVVQFTYWWFDGVERDSLLTGEVVYLPESMSYGLRGVKNKEWIAHIGGKEGESDTAPFACWTFEEADFVVLGNVFEQPELLSEGK